MTKAEYILAGLLNLLVITQKNMPGNRGKEVALIASSSRKSKKKKASKKKTSTLGPSSRILKKQSKKKKVEAIADKEKYVNYQKDGN